MKKTLHAILLATVFALPTGAFANDDNPVSHQMNIGIAAPSGGPRYASWVDGSMPCPSNTIHAEAIDISVKGNKGIAKSDMSLTSYNGRYMRCQAFMYFNGNSNPIEGIVVHGAFMNSSYTCDSVSCLGRLALENYVPTKPLRMGVAFYENKNGSPGKEIYKEEIDVYGEKSNGTLGEADHGEEVVPAYKFTLNFKEPVRLENGFVSVYAADTGEKYNTAFVLVHDANVSESGLLRAYFEDSSDPLEYSGCFNYCMLGDASKPLASKGLKFLRVLSPSATEHGKYAKVQVEISNYGSSNVNDATLQLYEDDNLLAEEKIDETIYSGTTYKYTFKKRIDCSAEGTHDFSIENATPGDDLYAARAITFSTTNNGGDCDSRSTYTAQYKYITSVDIGSIHKESSWSQYSDYRNMKTDIKPGETLTLNVEKMANNGDYLKVWVDWNGNGTFDDTGELMGYITRSTLDIKIPDNAQATAGEKTMRIVVSDKDVSPCEIYTFGETEDYTLNVVRPDNSPAIVTDTKEYDLDETVYTNNKRTLEISNEGDAELNANYSVAYQLPFSPDVTPIYKAPAIGRSEAPTISYAQAQSATAQRKPAETSGDPLVLTYSDDYSGYTGSDNVYVNYAHFYPGSTLKSIEGMKISSIDVYISSAARKSFVAVWKGAGVQYMSGEAVTKQQFTPVENSWNHIELENPVTLGDEDLFIGCALEGCKNITDLVGIDRGPAVIGYGDLICIENNNYWWSLADLGYDANVLIRANVTGQRTPAVSWLTIDKTSDNVAAGEKSQLNLTIDADKLGGTVYDAVIKIASNDQLAPSIKIPVYLDLNNTPSGIKVLKGDTKSKFHVTADRRIVLDTDSHVAYIALYTVDGQQVDMRFDTNAVSASNLKPGVYVAKAVLDDETVETASVRIK